MTERIHLEDFQGFRCTSCGLCCTRRWGVGVERVIEPGIRASEFHARRESEGYIPLEVSPDSPTRATKKEDGSCVFLEEENLCGLHSELGGQGKPVGCQLYPYRPVRTPTGVYVSQSFACPPVVAGLDDNVEENRAHLAAVLSQFPDGAAELPDEEFPVSLTQRTKISWSSYLELEERLLQAYDSEKPLDSLLTMTNSILLCETIAAGEAIETWPVFPPPFLHLEFEKELLRSYLIAVISIVERENDISARIELQEALAQGHELFSMMIDAPLPEVGVGFTTTAGDSLHPIFRRYFHNTVRGKLLLAPTVVARLLAVAIGYALLEIYLLGLCRRLNCDRNDQEALARAFEIVEADAISHSIELYKFFLSFEETLSRVVNSELDG